MTGSIYTQVPKPPALFGVPHVGDMPVPWVTCYKPDQPYRPDLSSPFGLAMGCDCVLGQGKPELGNQCPVRQRAAMVNRLCSACGGKVTEPALFAGVYFQAIPEITGHDEPVPITREAPTHPRCLAYSALVCPALARDPARCLVLPVDGDYPLFDQWTMIDGDPRAKRFVPHDTPRRHPLLAGMHLGALDNVFARLDLPGQTAILLPDWMTQRAPKPYRALWTAPEKITEQTREEAPQETVVSQRDFSEPLHPD